MMTLEKFCATRREVADLEIVTGAEHYDENGNPCQKPGYVYAGSLYIEREKDGRFTLMIGRNDWTVDADRLGELEKMLFEFAVDEQYFVIDQPMKYITLTLSTHGNQMDTRRLQLHHDVSAQTEKAECLQAIAQWGIGAGDVIYITETDILGEELTEEKLCAELQRFCERQALPKDESADDLLAMEELGDGERAWLEAFCAKWERVLDNGGEG